MKHLRPLWLLVALLLVLTACRTPGATAVPTLAPAATIATASPAPTEPVAEPATRTPPPVATATEPAATAEPTAEPAAEATTAPEPPELPDRLPPAVFFDLGETTITQARFDETSRFREMPVRLNGVMAVPETTADMGGPFPVVVIMHGTHPGCPLVGEVDVWPCGDEERANYTGFEYLVRELAARGYVALSINVNAENTFGFGEPLAGERLTQILDLHLTALAEAAAGGANNFGLELEDVVDLRRLAFIGHSNGGQMSSWLVRNANLDDPLSAANRGYGPVAGVLLVAPPWLVEEALNTTVPLAVILPACDGDVAQLDGQNFYEAMRFAEGPHPWAAAVLLDNANHNAFNTTLGPDPFADPTRPGCDTLLEPEAQRGFLVDYAGAFLTALFASGATAQLDAMTALGMGARTPAPAELSGLPARVSALAAADDRLTLFAPAGEGELTTNRLGGATTAEGVTMTYCPPGFNFEVVPGQEPCRRRSLTMPAYPASAVVSWAEPGAAVRLALPEGAGDLSGFTALSLRAVLDPMSELNEPGAYGTFSVRLTDGAGNSAAVATRPDEPALRFPEGETQASDFIAEGLFTGRAVLTMVRLPLADFVGVNLSDVREVALVFDQTPSGALFLADVEAIRSDE